MVEETKIYHVNSRFRIVFDQAVHVTQGIKDAVDMS